LLLAFAAGAARAQTEPTQSVGVTPGAGQVNEFFGAYQDGIPIAVPPFHGIEPHLSLAYSSQGNNGFVGVGWSLGGFDYIERASVGRGAPGYSAADVFVFDGRELIPCVAGSASPSCTSGGTHSTKIESYTRIAFDSNANAWTFTAKNGVRTVYSAVFSTSRGTFRWAISSVSDTSGNSVNYNYYCDSDCYLDNIQYNGTQITFYREARPDLITFADGVELGRTAWRLKTIDVQVGGGRARSYALTYALSAASGRSLLASVQELGKDAVISSGVVTGGTALPAHTMGYSNPGLAASDSAAGSSPASVGTGVPSYSVGDFNGDGKADYAFRAANTNNYYVLISNGTSFTAAFWGTQAFNQSAGLPESGFADFDGDGKTDFMYRQDNTNNLQVMRSTGSAFSESYWGTKGHDTGSGQLINCIADFNGDGRADYMYRRADSSQLYVMLSTGSSFAADSLWGVMSASAGTGPYQGGCGDLNGDGMADFMYREANTGNLHVLLSQGSSFAGDMVGGVAVAGAGVAPYEGGIVDVNGDGKVDFAYREANTQNLHVLVSIGNGVFAPDSIWGNKGYATGTGAYDGGWADVNGDGLNDYVFRAANSNTMYVMLSTGTAFSGAQQWAVKSSSSSTADNDMPFGGFGDFNGDGRLDYLYMSGSNLQLVANSAPLPDLITTLNNGLGGSATITYTPSSASSNTNNPPVIQTVTAQTESDGRGGSATTTFSYAGGLVDRQDRRFLGFHYAKETLPCNPGESACPYRETYFAQDFGSLSKPQEERRSSGAAVLLSDTQYVYTTNGGTIPYTSLETGHWEIVYDGTGGTACPGNNCRRTFVSRTFDGYANVTQEAMYGDYDLAGDEKSISYGYVPNSSAYVVGKPATITTFDGIGTAGTMLAQTLYYYDGAGTWNQAPTLGRATAVLNWLNTSNSYVVRSSAYDGFGNVTSETDELGNVTSYTLDPTYHLYRTVTTNALNQAHTVVYDFICGKGTVLTDPNGQTINITYDPLCRVTRTTTPLGGFENRSYVSIGDPNNQHIEVDTPAADNSGNQWMRSYLDGLGRTYQTTQKGPTPSQTIISSATFLPRGETGSKTPAHYDGESVPAETFSYDQLGRLTRQTHGDGTFVTRSYGLGTTTDTDELAHAETNMVDVFGHLVSHTETVGGVPAIVTHQYDVRGNLIQTSDGTGNVWSFTFDSLGRRILANDPDTGSASYVYDAAGHMTSLTDAKGQTTTFTYDAIGRRSSKTTLAGTAAAATVQWTFDEPRTGYFNIGYLSTVTDASGTAVYDHDAAGRLVTGTRTIDGLSYTFQKSYDAAGRLLSTEYPDGETVGPLQYDGAGRLLAIPGFVNEVLYDARGQLTKQTNANGTITTRSYSSQRLWLTGIATTAGTTVVQNLGYTRDAEGKITQLTSPFCNEGWSYSYDELHRLTGALAHSDYAQNSGYSYDPFGNMTSNTSVGLYAYGAPGQPRPHAAIRAGANAYAYDANGNMVSGAGRTITWNGENRPVTVNQFTFTYDADGARIKKISPAGTTLYLNDDYEIDNGTPTKYITLSGTPVAKVVGSAVSWLHTDHQGSIQVITDANGHEIQRQKYKPYGDRLSTSTSFVEARGYTGQRQDETGLFYLHARYYDPALARFISPDPTTPSGDNIGLNRYAYAGDDAVNNSDVDGLSFFATIAKTLATIVASFTKGLRSIPLIGGFIGATFTFIEGLRSGKGFAVAFGEALIEVGTAALTLVTGGLGAILRVAVSAAIGFGSGFGSALVDGASIKDALRAGAVGAAISAGTAAMAAFYQHLLHEYHSVDVKTNGGNGNFNVGNGQPGSIENATDYGNRGPNTIGPKAHSVKTNLGKLFRLITGKEPAEEGISKGSIRAYNIPILGHFINAVSVLHDWMGGTLGPPGALAENTIGPNGTGPVGFAKLGYLRFGLGSAINKALMGVAAIGTAISIAHENGASAFLVGDAALAVSAHGMPRGTSSTAVLGATHLEN
jgi:RHS repeat-associated protein